MQEYLVVWIAPSVSGSPRLSLDSRAARSNISHQHQPRRHNNIYYDSADAASSVHPGWLVVAMSSPSPPHDSPIDDSPSSDTRGNIAGDVTAAPTKPTVPVKQTPTPPQPPSKRSRPSAKDSCRSASGIERAREVKEDLSEMGFTTQRVKQIGGRKETRLADGQVLKRRLEQAAGIGQGRAKREGKGKAKDYEDLRLGKDRSESHTRRNCWRI